MSFLDWIKRRGNDPALPAALRESQDRLFAEWRQDHQLARQRNETGKEPESVAPRTAPTTKTETRKRPAGRERLKDHDIPF